MSKRLIGVALLVCAVLTLTALPALATDSGADSGGAEGLGADEEEVVVPERDEICSRNEIVAEYCPDRYEAPTVLRGMLYPLLGLGTAVAVALFLLYLRWLPNFAQERRTAGRRGRR